MSYLLAKILLCLLLAGLIGAVIGWLLRGGCSKRIKECEEDWKMKMGSLESEWNSKLQRVSSDGIATSAKETLDEQSATLKRHAAHVESQTPSYSYEEELKERLQQSQKSAQETAQEVNHSSSNLGTTLAGTGIAAAVAGVVSHTDDKPQALDAELQGMPHLEDDYAIEALGGVDEVQTQKLKDIGIHSTKDLSKFHTDNDGSLKIAQSLNVAPEQVESWIGKSCLLTLPGVDVKTAELLQNSGIKSVNELAANPPEVVHRQLEVFNNQALIPVELPDIKSVSLWNKIAKPLAATTAVGGIAQMANATLSTNIAHTSSYAEDLKNKLQPSTPSLTDAKNILSERGIILSEEKIHLYLDNGIDVQDGSHLEDNYDIAALEGIGSKYTQKLKEMGLSSTKELVSKLRGHHDMIDQVSKSLGIQTEALSSWISMADLISLPGVDAQVAELMQTVGISNISELSMINANSLHSEMVSFNKKSPIVQEVPNVSILNTWSTLAKKLG